MRKIQGALGAAALSLSLLAVTGPADAHSGGIHDNCTNLNNKWPHGVGRKGAHDKTTSGDPVKNFKRNTRAYNKAVKHNSDLDRDGDKIACEKH